MELSAAQGELEAITGQLVVARRSGNFTRSAAPHCGYCQYRAICRPEASKA
jgi:hypothetical protein